MFKKIRKWLVESVIKEIVEEAKDTFDIDVDTISNTPKGRIIRVRLKIFGVTVIEKDIRI